MEEMMTGQKVIKVFCHEDAARADFDKVNGEIFFNARNGNRFANILMPLLGNVGNVMYVVVALVGGALMLAHAPNISISGMAFGISIVSAVFKHDQTVCRRHRPGVQPGEYGDYGPGGHAPHLWRCWTSRKRPTRAMSPW